MVNKTKRIPVTIITGFLGSGKTTLLRYLLQKSNLKLAVIVNEFGSIGLDGDLLKTCGLCDDNKFETQIVELNNGCLCCTVQEEFLPTMESLLNTDYHLDGILIETSGLALPGPLLQALKWPAIRTRVFLDGVVTLVDGYALSKGSPVDDLDIINKQQKQDNSLDHITSINDLFMDQLTEADLVLISRADILTDNSLNKVIDHISKKVKNNSNNIIPISNGKINSSLILGIDRKGEPINRFIEHNHDDHNHLDVFSENIRIETNINPIDLEIILKNFISEYKILRIKGRCWVAGKDLPLQIQMVGSRFSSWFEYAPEDCWKPDQSGIDLIILSLKSGASKAVVEKIED